MNPFAQHAPAKVAGLLAFALIMGGCDKAPEPVAEPEQQEVILHVRTVDKTGAPVEMVRFYINGKKFGITDQDGAFKGRYPAKDGELLTFNVEAPPGYSVPANIDQSRWRHQVKYPGGRALQLNFTATLQRPERDYLFMVNAKTAATPVTVNAKVVGKTGASGEALVLVRGEPGAKFAARAGAVIYNGEFAEDEEVYLLTAARQGPVGGEAAPPVADAAEPPSDVPPEAAPSEAVAAAATEPPAPAAPETEPAAPVTEPPAVAIAPETQPAAPVTTPVAVARRDPPPEPVDIFEPAPDNRREARRDPPPERRDPAPVARRDPPPAARRDPPPEDDIFEPAPRARREDKAPAVVVDVQPEREAPRRDDALDELLADPVVDTPLPVDPPPVVAQAEPLREAAPAAVARGGAARAREEAKLGDGLIDDGEVEVKASDIAAKATVGGGGAPSASAMSREEISTRLDGINASLGQSGVLKKSDVDFLAQIDRTHPGYYEANRLLAEFYHSLKDYKRQAESLEVATSRGRYKHDPTILLSLAKAYALRKNYGKALGTMRRVEEKMRNLPASRKADAYRFYAEILEFEFLRQYDDDPKGANATLVDKAIEKWDRYRTFNRGADPGGVAKADKKIKELQELKQKVEL